MKNTDNVTNINVDDQDGVQQEQLTDQVCPNCGQLTMDLNEDYQMSCRNCKQTIPFEVYLVSLQLLQKQLIIELLRQFIEPGVGKCITYNNKTYVVGIDEDNEIYAQRYQLKHGEQVGMYVSLKYDNYQIKEQNQGE